MENKPPKVSVVIPNYNHAQFLKRRIDSVLSQTYPDFEVIILDDCSVDNSRDIIEKYRNNPKVTNIVYNRQNSGSTFPQWNKGVSLASGEFIWFAESDDYAYPEFLEILVPVLDQNPSLALVKCQSEIIDQENNILYNYEVKYPDFRAPNCILPGIEDCFRQTVSTSGIVNASAVLFRKEIYSKAGGAPENFKLTGDWMTWARMLGYGDIFYLPQPLNQMRLIHHNSARAAHMTSNQGSHIIEVLTVVNFILKNYKAPFKIKLPAINHQVSEWARLALNLKDNCIAPTDNFRILFHALKISFLALPLAMYHFPTRVLSVIYKKLRK